MVVKGPLAKYGELKAEKRNFFLTYLYSTQILIMLPLE